MKSYDIGKQRWQDCVNVSEETIPPFSPVAAFYMTTDLESYTSGSLIGPGVDQPRYPVNADGNRILMPVTLPTRVKFTNPEDETLGPFPLSTNYTNSHIGFNGQLPIESGEKGRCTWDCSPGLVAVNSGDLGHSPNPIPFSPRFTAKDGVPHLVNAGADSNSPPRFSYNTNIFLLIGVFTGTKVEGFPLGYVVRYRGHLQGSSSAFP